MTSPQAAPETLKNAAPVPVGHEVVNHTKLIGVAFVNAVPSLNAMTAAIGNNGVTDIFPARLDPDGSAVRIEKGQQTAGLCIKWKYHDRIQRKDVIAQAFVFSANIAGMQYGAP